ncbi:rho GTPase-activating protein 21-like [Pollicipes pollicipes]|uniref:rho GTPase-activating protein 21-like n=1 Tax=Pollicipes pollicipes TaxID=41117 RepID=UPI0018855515|nr:rho GTPase-activating protein 21-like [Pollicipes pollicipes]
MQASPADEPALPVTEARTPNAMLAAGAHTHPNGALRPRRPNFLPVTPCYDGPAGRLSPTAEETVLAGDPDTKSPPIRLPSSPPPEPGKTSTPNSLLGVVRRQKPCGEDDTDRTVRRISYLKATAGDGLFHTGSKEDRKPGKLSLSFQSSRKVSELPPKGRIQKLRNFFEEKAQNQLKRLERSTSIRATKPSSPTWPTSPPPQSAPAADAQREGWLRVKLAQMDGKRAPDRSWRELWAVLRGDALSFYRDRKEVNQTPSSLEEQPVNVALCQLDSADGYTRRKHVFRLLTHTGSEYLLQTEHLLEREAWLEALRPVCQALVVPEDSSRSATDSSLLSPTSGKAMKKLTSLRQRSPTGQGPNAKTRKPSQTPDQSVSPKPKTWKVRMARQLKKMHVGSPLAPAVQAVPDGWTLGVPLHLCPPSTSNELVPALVEMCTSLVEERGLDTEGLYRVPGNNAAIKSLSEAVNRGIHSVNLQADPRWTDVNVISSLLKSFFRKLPDSLVTIELYPQFIDTSKIEDPERRRLQLRKLVQELPDHNYETLKYLLRHLRRVTEHSHVNKMDLKNLAIVFGPTLVRSSDDSTSVLVTDMSQQCGIVKTLISEYDWFFPADETDEAADEPPPLPDSSPPLSAPVLPAPHHSPLFSTVQRMDSQGFPMDPKVIASSIILAASRKSQQARPAEQEPADCAPAVAAPLGARSSASECNNNQIKRALSASSAVGAADGAGRVHVIPIRLAEEPPQAAQHAPADGSESLPSLGRAGPDAPPQDDTAIPSYAGLSQTTQERIRRFEEETLRAMLQREKLKSECEAKDLDLQRARIEREWARAKQDLEQPDFLDELADNPAGVWYPFSG